MTTKWRRLLLYALLVGIGFISIVPFYMLIYVAISPSEASFSEQGFILRHFEWTNLERAWEISRLGDAMYNSAVITVGALLLSVASSAAASYAIARFTNLYHKAIFYAFLFSMIVPAIVNIVPLYILMKDLGGINTYWGMIVLLATGSIPFAVFLYTNFIRSISKEMEEAAIIDGCTWFSAFWRVVFPLLKPVTSTIIITNAVGFWNNYPQAVFFLQDPAKHTVPLAISRFVQTYGADYTLMAAASLVGMIPTVTVFFVFQRHFVKGMTAGAVKG